MSVSRFEIELDRPNGVYYTGEVLRGKVKLTTVGTVKTRGVRIRFRGESYVHWHTGSGDNRNDYYGNKIYEEHRYTIFGNYFNTAIIDNAGANAYFGSAGGDGIMYVPCNSDEHLRLIVRVMDYDFGKKDDICGEIVLDVSELAASGRAQSFPLRRKGNAEKGEVTLSARILPFDAIMSQSSMNANNYNSVCQLQAHQATGLRSANFIGKNDVYVQAYRLPDRGVNESKALPNPITDVKIPEGTMEFPFAFIIRADAPGSAEFHHGDDCYLRYSLYANIDKKWWLDPSVRRAITVLPSRPVPSAMLLRPVVHRGEQQEIASCYCCFWCTKAGKVVANMKLPKRSFVVGELLPVEVEVVNKSTSSVMAIELSLRRLVRMSTTGTYSAICYYDFYTPIVSSTVKPLGTYSFSNLNFHVPNNYPSFFGASGMAPNKKDPLTFAYSVLLVVKTPSMCSSTSQVEIPM